MDQFRGRPAYDKILAGEYELFSTTDSSQVVTESNVGLLTPGAHITMAVVIGRYEGSPKNTCPKPGCKSRAFRRSDAGGHIWLGRRATRFS